MFVVCWTGGPFVPRDFCFDCRSITQICLRAQEIECINVFKVSNNNAGLPLLQDANDTLCFVDGSVDEANCIIDLLLWFELYSGLSINQKKSEIFKINKVSNGDSILETWGCKEGVSLFASWFANRCKVQQCVNLGELA